MIQNLILFLLICFLSGCSILGGYQDETAMIIRTSKMLDKDLNNFDITTLNSVTGQDISVFRDGQVITGRDNFLKNDAQQMGTLRANGTQVNCCEYLMGPFGKVEGSLGTVWYVARMQMGTAQGYQNYQGQVTRIYEKSNDEWKLIHLHQNWQPENGTADNRQLSSTPEYSDYSQNPEYQEY